MTNFQSREYLENHKSGIPTGFIFVKIYCYNLVCLWCSVLCAVCCVRLSIRLDKYTLLTFQLSSQLAWFLLSFFFLSFFHRVSPWFVILIHFYCANESKDIAHCWRKKRIKVEAMICLSAKFQRAATIEGGTKISTTKTRTRTKKIWTNEIKHDVNKQNSIYWN